MLRFILLFVVALAIVAILTRGPAVWRALWVLLAIIGVYVILKATGVIDGLAPSRIGVF